MMTRTKEASSESQLVLYKCIYAAIFSVCIYANLRTIWEI